MTIKSTLKAHPNLIGIDSFRAYGKIKNKRFRLTARVSSSSPQAIRPILEKFITKGSVKKEDDEFVIETEMQGSNAKELNRSLLSALRKAEKKTRLRAEWTSDDGTTLRFFDYVLKKRSKN